MYMKRKHSIFSSVVSTITASISQREYVISGLTVVLTSMILALGISSVSFAGHYNQVVDTLTPEPVDVPLLTPFGSASDIEYAKALWIKMEERGFNSTPSILYVGGPPHGAVREVLEGRIDGRLVIVKRNYGGEGVSIDAVEADRSKYLKAITVMARHEEGYDPDNHDWFWVKYKPNGKLHLHPDGKLLAGRIAKYTEKGCIACHKSASGTNMVFSHNESSSARITKIK